MSVIQVLNEIQSEVRHLLNDTFSEEGAGSITCQVNAKVLKIINNSGLEKAAASASDGDIQQIADMFTRNIKLMNKGVDNINCDIKKGGAKSRSKKGGVNVSPSDMFLVGENTSSKSGGARGGMPTASRSRRRQQQQQSQDDESESDEDGPPNTPPNLFPGNGQSTNTGFGQSTGTGFGNTNPNAENNPFSNNTQTPSTNTQTTNEAPRSGFESRAQPYPNDPSGLVRRPAALSTVAPMPDQLIQGAMEAVAALDNYDFLSVTYLTLVTSTLHYTGVIAATIDGVVGTVGTTIGLTPLDTVCGIGSNAARRHMTGWISLGPDCQVAQGQWEVLIMGMAVMTSTILIILSARTSRRISPSTRTASVPAQIVELSMTGVTVVANQLRGCERGEESPPIEERSAIMRILLDPINGLANLAGRLFTSAGGLFRSNPELITTEPTNQIQGVTSVAAPAPAPTAAPVPTAAPTPIGRTTGSTNGVAQNQMNNAELRAARVARFENANSPNDSTGGRNKRRTRRRKSKASKKQRKTRRKISKKARKTKKAKKSKKSKKAKKSRKLKK